MYGEVVPYSILCDGEKELLIEEGYGAVRIEKIAKLRLLTITNTRKASPPCPKIDPSLDTILLG